MKNLRYICCALLGAGFMMSAEAKIGEAKTAIEMRMNSRTDGAYQYPNEDAMREMLELPYYKILLMQPFGCDNTFYFKRADRQSANFQDVAVPTDLVGWEVHYTYSQGKSVIEFYRRYGDPMTFEELEGLMNIQLRGKDDVHWVKTNYVPVYGRRSVEFKDGMPFEVLYTPEGKKVETSKEVSAPLKDILVVNPKRFIYVEIQDKYKSTSSYKQSLHSMIEADALLEANERYDEITKKRLEYTNQKTASGKSDKLRGSTKSVSAKGAASRKTVIPFTGSFYRDFESSVWEEENGTPKFFNGLKYSLTNVFVGDRPINNREKVIQWTTEIPLQPDTSVGYTYELSDGSVRAIVYEKAVFFIDTNFDSEMRKYMETLYEKQAEQRELKARDSLYKF